MPTLHWIGKDKVINHHMDVPFRVLEHSYGFDNGKQSEAETKSGNKIIHGDNLEALKALLPILFIMQDFPTPESPINISLKVNEKFMFDSCEGF